MINLSDTIIALSTPPGIGAIGVIRLSGNNAIQIVNTVFKGKNLKTVDSHTLHFGSINNGDQIIDEVVISIFKNPTSYTGEDVVEISCHGSPYILQQVIEVCIKNGARLAKAGEFTQRAFLNQKIDLASAEAVQDLIMSESKASHTIAIKQLRGGFTKDIQLLRNQLIHFGSLIELELDFGEEDVEFADRSELLSLVRKALEYIYQLTDSFQLGNAIKHGVNTVIAGRPNAGKSTLLNTLLNEDRAIVSDIAGTTRDTIEEILNIRGVQFRLIDTAGIREAGDVIEKIGVKRTMEKVEQASVIVYMFDASELDSDMVSQELDRFINQESRAKTLLVANKVDQVEHFNREDFILEGIPKDHIIGISALNKQNIEAVKNSLYHLAISDTASQSSSIVSNTRHFEALSKASDSLENVVNGIENGVSSDFVAMDIRHALAYLGEITGEITTDDLLDRIFREFCIGK